MFKLIKDFPNYAINKDGKIINIIRNSEIKSCKLSNGYLGVTLWKNNKQKSILVHRLIGKYFLSNPQNKPCINHKNFNKLDNKLENLEWVSYKENNVHSIRLGTGAKGEKSHFAKLTEKTVFLIRNRLKCGETLNKLAKEFNVTKSTISKIKNNKTWKYIGVK